MATLVLEDLDVVWMSELLKIVPPNVKVGVIADLTQGRDFFTRGDANKIVKLATESLGPYIGVVKELVRSAQETAGRCYDIDYVRDVELNLADLCSSTKSKVEGMVLCINIDYVQKGEVVLKRHGEVVSPGELDLVHWSDWDHVTAAIKHELSYK